MDDFDEEIPNKEKKEKWVNVRVPAKTWERLERLKSNPKNDIPEWHRKLLERELDKIGA